MGRVDFSRRINIVSIKPALLGQRFEPFTNIDGESFAKPSLGGFWSFEVQMGALDEPGMLAISALTTAMGGSATTLLPLSNQWVPGDETGRRLAAFLQGPEWGMDHGGYQAAPFDGYKLLAAGFLRDSYIDVSKPELSHIWPGHFITLGERLHQVIAVSAIDDDPTKARLTIRPGLRGNYPPGELVVVDYLVCLCRMQESEEVLLHSTPHQQVAATFVEAF